VCISAVSAQNIGINGVIYQDGNTTSSMQSTQNILPNNIAFEAIKIHIQLTHIASAINPEEESLATLKEIQDLSQTDIIE